MSSTSMGSNPQACGQRSKTPGTKGAKSMEGDHQMILFDVDRYTTTVGEDTQPTLMVISGQMLFEDQQNIFKNWNKLFWGCFCCCWRAGGGVGWGRRGLVVVLGVFFASLFFQAIFQICNSSALGEEHVNM